jgi:hypothetical protein
MSESAIDSETIRKPAPDAAKPKGARKAGTKAKPPKKAGRAKKAASKPKPDRANKKAEEPPRNDAVDETSRDLACDQWLHSAYRNVIENLSRQLIYSQHPRRIRPGLAPRLSRADQEVFICMGVM